MREEELLDVLIEHEINRKKTIHLAASENTSTVFSRLPFLLDLYNRYFFNTEKDDKGWVFRGVQDVHRLETDFAIPLLEELSDSKYVSLKPVSGLNGMLLALVAMGGGPGSTILTVSPECGGHYATKGLARSIGLAVRYMEGTDRGDFNLERLERQLKSEKISLVYLDQSNGLFPVNIAKVAEAVKRCSPSTLIHADMSHWLGFIFGRVLPNPLKLGANSFGGSTHKTFPGPQKAVFCTNDSRLHMQVKLAQHHLISSHHFGAVVSLGIALLEFKLKGAEYCEQMVANAQKLAFCLERYGYDVKAKDQGYTAGHQVWVSTNNCGVDSYEAGRRLNDVGIRVNAFEKLPGSPVPTLRLGVNEVTRLGAKEEHMEELSSIMHECISRSMDDRVLSAKVVSLRGRLPDDYGLDFKNVTVRRKYDQLCRLIMQGGMQDE